MRKLIIVLIILCLCIVPFGIYRHFNNKGEAVQVEIPQGLPAGKIADLLKEKNIIESTLWFKICLKFSGAAPLLRSGVFNLNKNTSSCEVIWRLTTDSGAELQKVVILEGWRSEEIAEELLKNRVIEDLTSFVQTVQQEEAEGYLFPSTYLFRKNTSPKEIIKVMTDEYRKQVSPLISQAAPSLSEREILTLASIVEREAIFDDERPKIAAVYLNRLKIGKRLEADPTVQYALGFNVPENRHWKKNLTLQDLRCDSPFNTYRNAGLPPAPIANPSLSSIKAVLNPQPDFPALYFVADNTGRHVFSRTYDQHIKNIRAVRSK